MAPSTPRFSFYTVTPGASAYMPDPEPEPEAEADQESQSQTVNVHLTCLYIARSREWQVARPSKVGLGGVSLVPLAG